MGAASTSSWKRQRNMSCPAPPEGNAAPRTPEVSPVSRGPPADLGLGGPRLRCLTPRFSRREAGGEGVAGPPRGTGGMLPP